MLFIRLLHVQMLHMQVHLEYVHVLVCLILNLILSSSQCLAHPFTFNLASSAKMLYLNFQFCFRNILKFRFDLTETITKLDWMTASIFLDNTLVSI
jgi:hypothetical protein